MKRGPSTLLWPREHGTYGELLFPLATALLLGRPGVTAWALCAVALGGFLAHEGFVVLAGLRGDRARREDGSRARTSLMWFGAVTLAGGLVALQGLDAQTAWATGGAILLACLAIAVAWVGAERSRLGVLMAACSLSAWCAPVSLAGGLPMSAAIGLSSIWCAVFALGTTAVECVMARSARRSPRSAQGLCVALAVAVLAGALVATRYGLMPPGTAWTLLPAALGSLLLAALPVHARHLRTTGWSIVAVSVLTLVLMLRTFAEPVG